MGKGKTSKQTREGMERLATATAKVREQHTQDYQKRFHWALLAGPGPNPDEVDVAILDMQSGTTYGPGPLRKFTAGARFDVFMRFLERYVGNGAKVDPTDIADLKEAARKSQAKGAQNA
jgi:hypothetical protein